MIYTFAVGWGLVGGMIPPARAYLLMAVPCLVPAVWCLAGALRGFGRRSDSSEQNVGLWVSGIGWLFLVIAFVAKHVAIMRAQPDAYAAQATSALTPFCLAIGVLCLLLGGVASWLGWLREEEAQSELNTF